LPFFSAGGKITSLGGAQNLHRWYHGIDKFLGWRYGIPPKKLVVPEINASELSKDDKNYRKPKLFTYSRWFYGVIHSPDR